MIKLTSIIFKIIILAFLTGCAKNAGVDESSKIGSSGIFGRYDSQVVGVGTPAEFQRAIGDRVLFAVDQSVLTIEAMNTLDEQADWLIRNSEYTPVVIEGHADEQGTREYNLALGARRANAVKEYLVSSGILASRLKTVSYGKERPIEICSAERCYEKNRRAVSVLDHLNF